MMMASIPIGGGPVGSWQRCECGEIQNAVHVRRCNRIGDGRGRSIEECMKDSEWCEEVANFLGL